MIEKNPKKRRFPLSKFPKASNSALGTFEVLSYLALFGGVIVYIKWLYQVDHNTAWKHTKIWWIFSLATYAISAILGILTNISKHLLDIKNELYNSKRSSDKK
ncbi:hypothetical protein ACFL02_08330 [Planctomycetota bacterium]